MSDSLNEILSPVEIEAKSTKVAIEKKPEGYSGFFVDKRILLNHDGSPSDFCHSFIDCEVNASYFLRSKSHYRFSLRDKYSRDGI